MRDRGLAEWLLKRAAGAERGTAIYGDLVELAATRSPAWFWFAYARTLMSLTWRTPVAFVVGGAMFTVTYVLWSWIFLEESRYHYRNLYLSAHPYLLRAVLWVTFELWFVLPYFAMRYGARDRLVRLTFAAIVAFSGASLFLPVTTAALSLAAVGLVLAMSSLLSAKWRGAGVTLIATSTAGAAVLYGLFWIASIGAWYYMKHRFGPHFELFSLGFALPHRLFWTVSWSIIAVEMLVLAILSARLHRRLIGRKQVATI